MITSKDNSKIKYARSLYSIKNRKKHQQFVVEGRNLVDMAKNANCVDYVITTNENIQGLLVSEQVMKSITTTVNTVEVIAICNMVEITPKYEKVLVLDNIQDPGNLGTLIRSALAFNIDTIICSNNTVDVFNEKVLRSSSGAIFYVSVIYCNIEEYLMNSSNDSIGTFIDGDNTLPTLDKYNIVIGNEGHGISDNIKRYCNVKYRIEMDSRLDSLNAGVAGSIMMCKLGGMI